MKFCKVTVLTIFLSLILSSCANSDTPASTQPQTQSADQTEIIQFYKDSVTQLQDELSALKEETYILSASYELKIRELEEQIESMSSAEDTTDDAENPNQSISVENQKAYYEYSLTENGAVITKYIGENENIQIPSSIDGRPVVKILEHAFSETKVKSIILPDGITELDWFAFYKCPFLEKIYIPASVKSIGYGAFDYCSSSLTIFCDKDSYAEKYAESFGISYEAS